MPDSLQNAFVSLQDPAWKFNQLSSKLDVRPFLNKKDKNNIYTFLEAKGLFFLDIETMIKYTFICRQTEKVKPDENMWL